MVKISRDEDGKTRVAKGDKSGLGGQYAPDPAKIELAKTQMEELKETLTPNYKRAVDNASLKKMGAISLAEIIAEANRVGDKDTGGRAMQVAESKGIWEETLGYSEAIRKTGDPFGRV